MCHQEYEIYTCTTEIPAIGPLDHEQILCGCSISAKGQEGRFKAMSGAPHRVSDFPVYCEDAEKNKDTAGTNCPKFHLEWTYTPDPHGRSCLEHEMEVDKWESEMLDRERKRASQDWELESARAKRAYSQSQQAVCLDSGSKRTLIEEEAPLMESPTKL